MSDEATAVRAAQDNPAAFGAIYERYLDRIYAYLRSRTGSPEDAADLTQQVFLQALHALPQYRGQVESFAPWLFRIARNAATDFHRRQRPTVAWDGVAEALELYTVDDLEADVARREAAVRLRALLDTVDADTREILVLRYGAQLRVKEIATIVGKSEAAVKKRLTRALRRLKEHYRDHT